MAKLISKTYGDALFELAIEENQIDALTEEIKTLQLILEENPEFSNLMNHPQILREEKAEVLESVFQGKISDALLGFIKIIILKDRYSQIHEILAYFLEEVKRYHKIGTAYVTAAMPLTKEQECDIENRLLETTAFEAMEMHYTVDPELIGGLKIRIGDRVVDHSIKRQLEILSKQMMDVQV